MMNKMPEISSSIDISFKSTPLNHTANEKTVNTGPVTFSAKELSYVFQITSTAISQLDTGKGKKTHSP
ncbi:hypothetical protein SERLA73DRAFT_176078 [Serpula lacrymans var. lacrymans S7.3]|uniref:Uncharacterized protein n=2 Tax=Serpula lacrymans var. lacrymans TaxID=341189 RepID=F8PMA1_SERL3|nr:uncharacterized protein SERLADRAFT_458823 [Serpula lacrymans var. lacrymans S7.9]EGO02733.1 hypothetical protein SERLA73DRAFT_176078 [Serpula lacrymans var. lacrymans S7.3]EGO28433.1 hypothetical protein SERLADRAFT_458823 [Serpula lacrymans var. lacrymans S7.9]